MSEFATKRQEIAGNITVAAILIAVAAMVLYALTYISVSVPTRYACHAAGWMNQKVDMNFSRYCYSRIDGSDIIVPYEEAVKNGNQSNLYIREVFKQYGREDITEAAK